MANCLHCNNEYISIRATSKYCSPKCRVYANRGKDVTISPKAVTLRDNKGVTLNRTVTLKSKPLQARPFDICPKHRVYKLSCGCR